MHTLIRFTRDIEPVGGAPALETKGIRTGARERNGERLWKLPNCRTSNTAEIGLGGNRPSVAAHDSKNMGRARARTG